jgi:hypothetical protein
MPSSSSSPAPAVDEIRPERSEVELEVEEPLSQVRTPCLRA